MYIGCLNCSEGYCPYPCPSVPVCVTLFMILSFVTVPLSLSLCLSLFLSPCLTVPVAVPLSLFLCACVTIPVTVPLSLSCPVPVLCLSVCPVCVTQSLFPVPGYCLSVTVPVPLSLSIWPCHVPVPIVVPNYLFLSPSVLVPLSLSLFLSLFLSLCPVFVTLSLFL